MTEQGVIHQARKAYPDGLFDFRVGSATKLPVEDNEFDVVVSGLALNFFPELDTAVGEMCRVVRPGCTVAVFVWDYASGMEMLRYFWDGATTLDGGAAMLDEGKRFPICQPEPLQQLFTRAGLMDIEVRPLDSAALFQDFDDYWQPFLGQNGPAPGYVAGLTSDQREALADHLGRLLPIRPDGTLLLNNRAWAVRGVKS